MTARRPAWLAIAVAVTMAALAVATASGCAREAPPVPKELTFGARRVLVIVPKDWEPLDQGKQKRFRNGEFEIVLQDLGPKTPPPRDLEELVEWGLAEIGHDGKRREEKSRRPGTVDGREAFDIETWNLLDHTNPQRIFFVIDEGNVLALYTERMAFEASLKAFDVLRSSLHFANPSR